ncbi:hypothetical protein [Confluentibacter flavum]|uniref:hypothetical protein n=1 Tax=Confluentibacter flavum TaxID=1909700 RepID=UPI0012FF2C80|nr:hypothetical protein [Confluentibacter flavum]
MQAEESACGFGLANVPNVRRLLFTMNANLFIYGTFILLASHIGWICGSFMFITSLPSYKKEENSLCNLTVFY